MFENLQEFFLGGTTLSIQDGGEPTDETMQVAVAALLYQVVAADDGILSQESRALHDMLVEKFKVSEEHANFLMMIATERSVNAQIPKFLEAVNEHFSEDQRREVLRLAEELALVDGRIDLGEAVTRDILANKLGVETG